MSGNGDNRILNKRPSSTRNKMGDGFTQNAEKRLYTMASTLVARATIARQLGQSFGGDRDLYTALGYYSTQQLTYSIYKGIYDRQDVATRIVDAPTDESWRKRPELVENLDDETTFEKEWKMLQEDLDVYGALNRTEKLAGIGKYAVLLVGFDDVHTPMGLREPVGSPGKILYLRPYSEGNATIKTWDQDPTSKNYARPLTYGLTAATAERTGTTELIVHYTRVIHIARNTLEDDILGTPELQNVFNRLQDLEKVAGGSGEMYWKGAFPGYNFSVDKDAQVGVQNLDDLQDEIEDYMHKLNRYVRTRGVTVESLEQQVADPTGHANLLLELIAIAKGMPVRILKGSERGELSSGQDATEWNNKVEARQTNFVTPKVIRPFVNLVLEHDIISEPADGTYEVIWPPVHEPSEKDKAEGAKEASEALAKYAGTPGTDMVIPPKIYLREIMKLRPEVLEEIDEQLAELVAEEQRQIQEGDRALREEEERLAREGRQPFDEGVGE